MDKLLYAREAYELTGICMDVHNQLRMGFLEIVYKDTIEHELRNKGIWYEREKEYEVSYKDITLRHKFYADFVVYDKIILEVKSVNVLPDEFIAQCINYCKVSRNRLALLVNFGELKLKTKRVVV